MELAKEKPCLPNLLHGKEMKIICDQKIPLNECSKYKYQWQRPYKNIKRKISLDITCYV